MYEIELYRDKNGESELKDWITDLKRRKDKGIKEARILFNQIQPNEIKKAIKMRDDWNARNPQ